ncbi:hypothetical protein ACVBIL_14965 [Shewanella sp. 125m-7]
MFIIGYRLTRAGYATDLAGATTKALPKLAALSLHLHQSLELSCREKASSARIAKELASLGFDVTENVGVFGVVGILKMAITMNSGAWLWS